MANLDEKCRRLKGTIRKMGDHSEEVREMNSVMRDLCEFGKPMEKEERRPRRVA